MNTNLDGIKAIYVALGGEQSTAASFNTNAEALAGLTTLLGGNPAGLSINSELLTAISQAASGYLKPTGTKTITANGTGIDVAKYEKVDVNVSVGST